MDLIASAFLVTLLAGLSTGFGSAMAFFVRRITFRFLAAAHHYGKSHEVLAGLLAGMAVMAFGLPLLK
jgi:zinc transporter ZupT